MIVNSVAAVGCTLALSATFWRQMVEARLLLTSDHLHNEKSAVGIVRCANSGQAV